MASTDDSGSAPDLSGLGELGASGRRLAAAVLADFTLDEHESTLLREACRTADLVDRLQETIDADPLLTATSQGQRIHPAITEIRQQRIALARILAALRMPAGDESQGDQKGRQQRRMGVRGVYGGGAA